MNAKRILKLTVSFAIVFILLTHSVNAWAINYDYLDINKWKNNDNVTVSAIERSAHTARGNFVLSGNYGVYADDSTMTLYTYFDINEQPSSNSFSVNAEYYFTTPSEKYTVSIDENGITEDTPPQGKTLFSGASKLYDNKKTFISIVQYNGKEDYISASVRLSVNDHRYLISEGIALERPTAPGKSTTTRSTTTKKANNKSNKKSKTNKAVTKYTPKGYAGTYNKSNKNSAANNNKYETNGTVPNNKSPKKNSKNNDNSVILAGEENLSQPVTALQKPAFLLLILAIIIGTAGVTLLITSIVIKTKNKNEKQDSEEKEETEEKEE